MSGSNTAKRLVDRLKFTCSVSTSHKILFLGDSVSMQLSQTYEEAAGSYNRKVLKYSWGTHEGIHVAQTNGGGVVAGYRLLHFFRSIGLKKHLPNSPGGGWRMEDVQNLLNYEYSTATTLHNNTNATIAQFDVLVFRIPHGWISFHDITLENLLETIQLAQSVFGVKKVIILTVPFSNNVETAADLLVMEQANHLVRSLARKNNNNSTIQVAVLELGNLVQSLVEDNGRRLGMNVSSNDYMNQRCCPVRRFHRSVPLVCSQRMETNAKQCQPNHFSLDGMHYCFDVIGGRMVGGISCLIGCKNHACEDACNKQFMSLEPILF